MGTTYQPARHPASACRTVCSRPLATCTRARGFSLLYDRRCGSDVRSGARAGLQIAARQRMIEIWRDDLRCGDEPAEVDARLDRHAIQHVHEILGCHVARCARRVRTATETA